MKGRDPSSHPSVQRDVGGRREGRGGERALVVTSKV